MKQKKSHTNIFRTEVFIMKFRTVTTVLLILLCWAAVAYGEMVSVAVDRANIRETPKINQYNLFIQAPIHYPLRVLGTEGAFYKVMDYRGQQGYIDTDIVDKTRSAVVTVGRGNLRSGPGTSNKVILRAERGVSFKVIKESGEWLQLEHASGSTGWMHKNLLWGY